MIEKIKNFLIWLEVESEDPGLNDAMCIFFMAMIVMFCFNY